uniref:Uncharacterized protein n=1 Tax=Cyclopterus lumpus TaxID=8103 RepID=A0A8C2ZZV9_CYCLU
LVSFLPLAVQVAHDDQLGQLLVRVHGDLQAEEPVGVRPRAQRVLGHGVGAGVPVGRHGDGEEGAHVRVLGDGQREDGRGELRRVVVDVQHLDAALDQPRPRADALHHVGDGHLELQEALAALEQVAAVPQRLAVDGDLRGVDVARLAVHAQVRRAHLQLVEVPPSDSPDIRLVGRGPNRKRGCPLTDNRRVLLPVSIPLPPQSQSAAN